MKRIISILICVTIYGNLIAQQYNFHNYSVKDGVAQSQVYSLLQDSRGYLWMGTFGGGLTRFDGVKFTSFSVRDSLVNNYVFCVKEDSQQNLWIGTINGLSKYNGLTFKNYQPHGDSSKVWIKEIDFDKKGRKWLATNVGVLFLDDKGFTNVTELLKEKQSVINALLVDKEGNVWIGAQKGIVKITENNHVFDRVKFDKSNGFTNNSITSIKQDHEGNLWIGTYGDGAYVYNGRKFFRVDHNLELYKQTVNDFYFDSNHNVWMATLNGVCQYNINERTFTWLTDKEGLSNNNVRSIIQDKSGNYWFGTSGGGVCNYFGKQFTNYDRASGLGGDYIYSIFRDSKKRLWIGTGDNGVSVYDTSKFSSYNSLNGFINAKVKTIAEDDLGKIYFGTEGQGAFVFDGIQFIPIEGLAKKFIRSIIKDKDGNIWFATAGSGLYKLILNEEAPRMINITTKDGLLHNRVICLHYDKQGRLWYGTEDNGIGYLQDDKVQKLVITTKKGLRSNSIRCLTEDKSGYLWVGTVGYGISSFPLYQGDYKVSNYDHTNGLTSSNIYLLTIDNDNNLIVGTETGLDHVFLDKDRKPNDIKHYGKGEGFTGIETCLNSVFNDEDGTIWFGTINCLSKYNPANKVKNENPPVINITDVKLFYESISENSDFKQFIGDWNKVSSLELPHDQNNLGFDFVGINFSNPDAVKYQWRLIGSDKDWSPPRAQNNVNYSNLGAGSYTFMVRSCNEDGVWNKEPVTFSFHISPPFWLRWWFIVSMIVIGAAIILIIFKWRVNRIKAKAEEEQKQLQLEKEVVELEQKALRLQMNPHFIFNALNSIQSQIGTDNEQAARYYLAKFSRLMRQILDNSRNATITLEEEVNTLENYLLIEKFCNGDRFDYKISVADNIEKDYVKIPPMLLQPFIENAIKHGLKYIEGKRGMIEVNFTEKNNSLECSVTDNGIGRVKAEELNKNSKETYHKSTALIVTQERLDLLKKDENIQALEIIDLYDENEKAVGTKVIIRIPIG